MSRVTVRILHPAPDPAAGPLTRALAAARAALAERHRRGFLAAGADDVRVLAGAPDDTPFGARLRSLARAAGTGGLVVLGSGALPLASAADRRRLTAVAAGGDRRALANNRYSADAIALGRASIVADVPDLATDNALPRWLEEQAGIAVDDLRASWRMQVDIDSPLDAVLCGRAGDLGLDPAAATLVGDRLAAVRRVAADRTGQLLVAGRTSPGTLRWLERGTAARIRALVEERGLRTSRADQAPPASVLGLVLDRDGPEALGALLARLCDAALIDSRVLLAHRHGADEAGWPGAEDRFASDLLDAERIRDPWLRALTAAARDAPIPIVLGGHTLVGPGVRLALRPT